MNHAPTAHATTNRLSFTVKFSYKPLIYFASGFFWSQISQAFEHLLKTNKPLTTNHLPKTPHFLRVNNRPKAVLLPAKSITMTRQKGSFEHVKV